MFVLIIGGGKLGAHLACMLHEAGHEVTVVEQDAERVAMLGERCPGAHVIHGDGCEPVILESARIASADAVAAVTGDDEDNLVVCLLAKREYGVDMTVARTNDPRNEWLFDRSFGVDVPVSNTTMIARLLLEQVSVGHIATMLRVMRDGLALVELTIPDDAPSLGVPLADLAVPPDARLVAIVRDGRVAIPTAESALLTGDEVLAVTSVESEAMLSEALVGRKEGRTR